MKLQKFLSASVATRTTIFVIIIVTLIMIVGGLLQVQHVRSVVGKEMKRQATRSIEGVVKVIDNRISNVETAVITAAAYADIFAQEELTADSLLYRLISSNKDIAAATLLYRADYFANHGRYYAPTITRDPISGKLEHDEIGGPENDFCYIETDSNWVYTNILDDGYWCLPYLDSMSTKRAMVTYSVPLHERSGDIYAVLCADIDLHWVQSIVEEAKPYSYSKVGVLSRDSQYVCHPDSNYILTVNAVQFARQTGNDKVLSITERMLRKERGSDTLESQLFEDEETEDSAEYSGPQIAHFAPIERMGWSVCFTIPEKKIMEEPNQLSMFLVILLIVLQSIIAIALYIIIRAQMWPLKQLALSTQEIAKGNFSYKLPVIYTKDEVANLRDSFEEMRHSLTNYIDDLQNVTAARASMDRELRVAKNIQMAMLPKVYPPFPDRNDIDIFGSLTPAKEVGGDLYDYYIRDEKLLFCIGDVSGKGIPASIVMAMTKVLFRTNSAHETSPERIMEAMNKTLSESNDSNMFVTLFIGVLDLPTGRMRFCNAGHNAPMLIGSNVGMLPIESNIPLAVMDDWKFVPQNTLIDPNTTLLLYTDGLTEAENTTHVMFGEANVMKILRQMKDEGIEKAETIINRMSEAVAAFVGEAEQSDDLTMLAIKYTKHHLDVIMQQSISINNNVENVPLLSEFVEQVCEKLDFDPATTMQMNLAIEEAVVNVMNYAYPEGTNGQINIEAQANNERLKFKITDTGVPFDPTAKEEVDTSLSLVERPIGGLGIHLIRQLMDSINYERVDGMNILTLRKKLH